MAKAAVNRALILALALAGLSPRLALAQVEGAPRVIDGATLAIDGRRFVLHGITVPALKQSCRRMKQAYPCGQVARAMLWELIGGRDVSCVPVEGEHPAGAAIPAICSAGDINLNESMVRSGWALADRTVEQDYAALEDAAKKARRGLWSGEFDPATEPEQTSVQTTD
jgi:endonuclease YncB( thermonuclease family)